MACHGAAPERGTGVSAKAGFVHCDATRSAREALEVKAKRGYGAPVDMYGLGLVLLDEVLQSVVLRALCESWMSRMVTVRMPCM